MSAALAQCKTLEDYHCQAISEILYEPNFKHVSVAHIKNMLAKASPQMATLLQHTSEVKFLLQKHKAALAATA